MKRKGFTLVELLVVVTVIAIMLGMVVRFGNIGEDAERRNITITRMQRLENALSGYYAAFGTYPPVRLQGSRNYFLAVSDHGIQNTDGNENSSIWGWINSDGTGVSNWSAEQAAWAQVEAACRSQPVGCYFPYPDNDAYKKFIESYSESMKSYAETATEEDLSSARKAAFAAGFDTGVPIARFSSYRDKIEWEEVQLFRFGLLSFLLPRYLFMMEGPEELFENYKQWTGNNELPCDPLRGTPYTGGWKGIRKDAGETGAQLARVANIPSQAACARWIANFEKSLSCARERTFFGVDVMGEEDGDSMHTGVANTSLTIYSPGGYANDSHSGQYVLNSITMKDGWENEFFYYSPAPYQSYVVWSAGPNGRTFPPWVARDSLSSSANKCIAYWISDDIVGLKK